MTNWIAAYQHWVLQLDQAHYWMLLLGTAIGAVVALFAFASGLHRTRIIEDTPTAKIRSAPQGFVELEGWSKLIPGPTIVAPLTGLPCVWYRYVIEEYRSSGKSSSWHVIQREISEHLFHLDDTTGQVVVDPQGATVKTNVRDRWRGSSRWPTQGKQKNSFLGGRYRYTEERIPQEVFLYALGLFRTQGVGYQESLATEVRDLLTQWKKDPDKMKAFDTNNDGTVDIQEWESAQEKAKKTALLNRAKDSTLLPVNVLSKPHNNRQPYILSMYPQDELTQRYRWQKYLGMLFFVLLATISTISYFIRFS